MEHKYITLAYKLYTVEDGSKGLIEQTTNDEPFEFITGLGMALDEFERQVSALQKGEEFAFTLTPEQAYGEYFDNRVVEMDRNDFVVDGRFDEEHVFQGAFIPLQNEQGDRFMGHVAEITSDKVVIDLNHPLAGQELEFNGVISDTRDATDEELFRTINGGCGGCGGCGNCDDDCGGCEDNGKEKKHCGHCHH